MNGWSPDGGLLFASWNAETSYAVPLGLGSPRHLASPLPALRALAASNPSSRAALSTENVALALGREGVVPSAGATLSVPVVGDGCSPSALLQAAVSCAAGSGAAALTAARRVHVLMGEGKGTLQCIPPCTAFVGGVARR